MGKMIFTIAAVSALLTGPNFVLAEAAKTKPAKQTQTAKKETCEKCKNAKKPCTCEASEKHSDHDHDHAHEGDGHDHKKEEKKSN